MTIRLLCPKCGIIKKSGRVSCCGRGGSWFGNCGAAGEEKLDHKWSEGFQACKSRSRSKRVIGQQLHGEQHESNGVSDDTDRINSEAVITTVTTFTSRPVNISTPMRGKTSVISPSKMSFSESVDMSTTTSTDVLTTALVYKSANTSISAQGCRQSWDVGLHLGFLVLAVLI